ncbi:MAG: SDR family NAD(P)-dependent oxidoreductase [Candidatus Bathyarchaeia archaeon]
MNNSRILVTGGAGFIGSRLVDRLLREGHEVTVLDNLLAGTTKNLKEHLSSTSLHMIKADVRNSRAVKKAVRGATTVFHLAALVDVPLSVENPVLTNDVNVRGTLSILEASLAENVDRFIYISSSAVYGEARYLPINEEHPTTPLSPYGVSKLAAENYCRNYHEIHGLKTCCLRLFNVYGPRQHANSYSGVISRFIRKIQSGESPVVYGDGKQTRDFIHLEDVIDACVLPLESVRIDGGTFNVGTGKPTTIRELADIITELSGKTSLKPVYEKPRKGDVENSYADINMARKSLNFKPKTELKNGLKSLIKNEY